MISCRTLLALYVASVAFTALVTLAVCNRMLMALQDDRSAAREALGRHKEPTPVWLGEDAGMMFAGMESRRN